MTQQTKVTKKNYVSHMDVSVSIPSKKLAIEPYVSLFIHRSDENGETTNCNNYTADVETRRASKMLLMPFGWAENFETTTDA